MLGIIAGTGLQRIKDFSVNDARIIQTPYGPSSGELLILNIKGQPVAFMPRHGKSHSVPPHLINYRANIWALKEARVKEVLAFAAVGGITDLMQPGTLLLPDQIVDYTYSREQTFFTENFSADQHIDFTNPYSRQLADKITRVAGENRINLLSSGTYACTQGPRLETAAEIRKLKNDGCDIVGMTAMPEAALACELEMDYQTLAIVVNWAAGISQDEISIESIMTIMTEAEEKLEKIISALRANQG